MNGLLGERSSATAVGGSKRAERTAVAGERNERRRAHVPKLYDRLVNPSVHRDVLEDLWLPTQYHDAGDRPFGWEAPPGERFGLVTVRDLDHQFVSIGIGDHDGCEIGGDEVLGLAMR